MDRATLTAAARLRRGGDGDAAYERLRSLIVSGALAPGARLVESELAQRLGVSRTPVREALRRLVGEGFVASPDTGQYARLSVTPLTTADGAALFRIVGALEGEAARDAAALPDEPRAALAEAMKEANRAFRKVAESSHLDPEGLQRLDETFHGLLVAQASQRLQALHAAVKPQAARYENLYVTLPAEALAASVAEHKAITRAVRAGDADEAERAVQANWRRAAERLAAVVAQRGERGTW